ncbi:MAG: M48 family metalloprotease [Planctomycetales bacterium]|nr:M48 family metalloprotease [Planctomycetales bacterium]
MITELMDRLADIATTWLSFVLLATWKTLPILLLVTGIGLALRRKLSSSMQAMLWTIIIVRLLLPASVCSPLSLHKPIDGWFSSFSRETTEPPPRAGTGDTAYRVLQELDSVDIPKTEWGQSNYQPVAMATTWEEILWSALLSSIVLVSIGLILRNIFSHLRFAMQLRSCRPLEKHALVDLLLRECDSLAVGRRPAVLEVPSLAAPAVFGAFRQTICLPPGLIESLSEQQLRWVIRHELAHIRRRDIPVLIMASIASAFHWFNPIVWLIVSRLQNAIEAAADNLALKSLTHSEASAYGKLLMQLAEVGVATKKSPTLGLISFASGKHLKQRVMLLMRETNSTGVVGKLLIPCLVSLVAIAGLTDAMETPKKMPELHFAASELVAPKVQPLWTDPFAVMETDGPTFVEEYDLDSIFKNMPKSPVDNNKSTQDQLASWIRLSESLNGKWHVTGTMLSADLNARQHQLLKQMLEIWKHGEPKQISIEIRFIQTNLRTASTIDWAGNRIDELTVRGLGPAIAARVDESELARLVRTVSVDNRSNILLAPKVTLFDGQTAGIADQVQHPFITGVEPTADGGLQPVVSVVDEGLRFVLSPRVGDADRVTLTFEVVASNIEKVSYANLPFMTDNSAAPQFTVQVPVIERYEVSSTVKLSAGESIVVAIPRTFNLEPGADAETTMIVALTPRIIADQETSDGSATNP